MGEMINETVSLGPEEFRRYSRHLILPEVGLAGQEKLKAASVLLIGGGGLGSPLAMYLAAAGVGRIGMVDFDIVDESNLQRQLLHFTPDVGRTKLASAADKVRAINPHVLFEPYETRLTAENALEIVGRYDVVIDGTDNYPTRYLVNDACVLLGKPNVYGSIFRFEGQLSVFDVRLGPCYRCLYPEPPPPGLVPSCAEGGVLGVLPGVIGVLQATEAIKIILGIGDTMAGRLVLYDALATEFRSVKVRKDPDCPLCGEHPTIVELVDYEQFCGVGIGEEGSGVQVVQGEEVDAVTLKAMLDSGEEVVLIDVREPYEAEICRLPGAVLIPQGQVPGRLEEIPRAGRVVIFCRSGARSRNVIDYLKGRGYDNLINLTGGILAWGEEVDPRILPY